MKIEKYINNNYFKYLNIINENGDYLFKLKISIINNPICNVVQYI